MRCRNFDEFFKTTVGHAPFPFQRSFAAAPFFPELVQVPTGLGKTAMAVVGWLWRRFGDDGGRKATTPRRLVYCLPMRVLVEQTRDNAVLWLNNAGLLAGRAEFDQRDGKKRLRSYTPDPSKAGKIAVHVLMGGAGNDNWDIHPEQEAILVGTQDMLLSRALNRGYAAARSRWPIQFGLLHTDCLWVFDEIQLMGTGLATTAQLEAFRRMLPSRDVNLAKKNGDGSSSVWMSATFDMKWLETVDFKNLLTNLPAEAHLRFDFGKEIASSGLDLEAKKVIEDRWKAWKTLYPVPTKMGDEIGLAEEILKKHAERRGLTLVVINTVSRAQALQRAIQKRLPKDSAPKLVLIHSRFRPPDRERKIEELLDQTLNKNMICVSTQVVEAGVDVDATTLFTELAPWASLVQRFGRCNRRGQKNDATRVYWIGLPSKEKEKERVAVPYDVKDLQESAEYMADLNDVGIKSLPKHIDLRFDHTHVIRRRDLIDLFDTTPDLAGNDIDIDRFVREVEETDVRLFWREWDLEESQAPPDDKAWRCVAREELCPAPVGSKTNPGFRQFASKHKRKVWRWDYLVGTWGRVDDDSSIYPGQTYLIHSSAGGYHLERGWIGTDGKKDVAPLGPTSLEGLADDAYDDDGLSKTDKWQTIAQHTDGVCREVEAIIGELALTNPERRVLRTAARWHDWGKAHAQFQLKIDDGQQLAPRHKSGQPRSRRERPQEWRGCRVVAKAPRERVDKDRKVQDPGYWGRITVREGARRYLRHELASALGVLLPDTPMGNANRDLVAYLIAAHHGKVRLSIRSMPNETRPPDQRRFARGVWERDELPETELGGGVAAPCVRLSLELMELGLCEEEPFEGQPSWLERAIRLRDTLGPFRLAYLEALLRAADWRASALLVRSNEGQLSEEAGP